jgi:ferredoxin-NADP reductase
MDRELRFAGKREVAPGVWEFMFHASQPVEYTAGQYAKFLFPFHIDDPRGKQHRTFTLTSLSGENTVRFLTRVEEPLSAYKQALSNLTPGETLFMREPMGDAVLPRSQAIPLVFVAQGIAIASYVAMLGECVRANMKYDIALLWAKRSEDNRLESLIPSETGLKRVDFMYPKKLAVQDILKHVEDNSLIYLSGSQNFVETLGANLETQGISRARIIYDYYSGYDDL